LVTDAYLDYDELSTLLKLPKGTLYAWVHQGVLPHVRLGSRTVRFRRHEIEAWIDERSRSLQPGRSDPSEV